MLLDPLLAVSLIFSLMFVYCHSPYSTMFKSCPKLLKFFVNMYLFVMYVCAHLMKNNLWESVLFFHCVDS